MLSIDEIKTLVEQPQGLCVSLYMPTVRLGSETQQNPIRFKNLIKQAEAKLQEYDIRHTDALKLLQPALDLDKEDFWQHQEEGLAIFVAEDFFRYYCLPLNFDELVVVSDRFHLKPLLPLLTGDGKFYLLALSQKQIRLFEGSRYSIREIELDEDKVPQSLAAALNYDEPENSLQNRIGTSKGGTSNSFVQAGSFHGQGSPDTDDNRRNILQFFLGIDRGIQDYLKDKRAPLILAGVEYLFPIYQEANSHPHLIDKGITENVDILKPEEIHQQAWAIVEPYYMQDRQAARDRYQELTVTGKASDDPNEVIRAAYYGRVEQLFVAVGQQKWGSFDPQTDSLQFHAEAEPGDEDLLDAAAIQTLFNSGTVYAVEPEQVPHQAPVAAIFRY
jgi:Bacterial archaeo-eukaryotic release factor family 3